MFQATNQFWLSFWGAWIACCQHAGCASQSSVVLATAWRSGTAVPLTLSLTKLQTADRRAWHVWQTDTWLEMVRLSDLTLTYAWLNWLWQMLKGLCLDFGWILRLDCSWPSIHSCRLNPHVIQLNALFCHLNAHICCLHPHGFCLNPQCSW